MERISEKKIALAVGVLTGLACIFIMTVAPDPKACEQAKQALSQHTVRQGFSGLGDRLRKLGRDRETLLSGGSPSAVDELAYELRQQRSEREGKQERERLKRERDQACRWF